MNGFSKSLTFLTSMINKYYICVELMRISDLSFILHDQQNHKGKENALQWQ